MDETFIGDVRPWPHPVPPDGWLSCDGSLLPIEQYDALFNLIGTTYGGDGQETFAVPDLRGRFPMGLGSGPGLTPRSQGQFFGVEQHTLAPDQMPVHAHPMRAQSGPATTGTTANAYFADGGGYGDYNEAGGVKGTFAPDTLKATGGSLPHNNMPPFVAMNFIIAVFGVYPSPD